LRRRGKKNAIKLYQELQAISELAAGGGSFTTPAKINRRARERKDRLNQVFLISSRSHDGRANQGGQFSSGANHFAPFESSFIIHQRPN